MQKNKFLSLLLSLVIFFSLVSLVIVKAQVQTPAQNQAQNQGKAQQLQEQNQEQNQEGDQEENGEPNLISPPVTLPTQAKTKTQNKGQIKAQEHRSMVANFVQELLETADDMEGGVGEQVRTIARQQNQAEEKTIQAMETVQNRNRVKTFLIGSDYKNLGALRSEMVQTRNRLRQLNQLMENVENEEARLRLENQIQEMEQEQTRIEEFIKGEEGRFSLFGWLVKFFNR